ncbi:MAG: hypothetical protein AAF282_00015 [Cyanobacteria bacterium P01_A01_bin.15]
MTHPERQSTPTEKLKDNFSQIKAEGDTRFKKIAQILRASIVESANELKAGAASPATKEFRDTITQRIKETSQETLAEAQEVWTNRAKEETFQDWLRAEIQAVTSAMKATLSKQSRSAEADKTAPPRLESATDRSTDS